MRCNANKPKTLLIIIYVIGIRRKILHLALGLLNKVKQNN
jgi:hypothetical protein